MHRIMQANIDRFNALLKTETDPVKRAMITRLLGEEREKLRALEQKNAAAKEAS